MPAAFATPRVAGLAEIDSVIGIVAFELRQTDDFATLRVLIQLRRYDPPRFLVPLMSDQSISQLFSLEGPLAAIAPGFRVRPSQIELAQMVERTIGHKVGTGGSSGADYLKSTLFNPVFADLWEIRSRF